jgi:hypothetical protein
MTAFMLTGLQSVLDEGVSVRVDAPDVDGVRCARTALILLADGLGQPYARALACADT